jgi:hypothetical protein
MNITDGEAARVSNSLQEVRKLNTAKLRSAPQWVGHLAQPPLAGRESGQFSSDAQNQCVQLAAGDSKDFPSTT